MRENEHFIEFGQILICIDVIGENLQKFRVGEQEKILIARVIKETSPLLIKLQNLRILKQSHTLFDVVLVHKY
jgi:hypothetical protein